VHLLDDDVVEVEVEVEVIGVLRSIVVGACALRRARPAR
jgi:hypothetical protein